METAFSNDIVARIRTCTSLDEISTKLKDIFDIDVKLAVNVSKMAFVAILSIDISVE